MLKKPSEILRETTMTQIRGMLWGLDATRACVLGVLAIEALEKRPGYTALTRQVMDDLIEVYPELGEQIWHPFHGDSGSRGSIAWLLQDLNDDGNLRLNFDDLAEWLESLPYDL